MKKGNIYAILFAVLLVAAAGFYMHSRNIEKPIPPLHDRQGPIATTSEWLNTKAAIEGLQYKLRKNSGDTHSKLLLAMAYMQEARVTGDHPYYYPAALELVNDVLDRKNIDPAIRYEAIVAKASIQLSLHQFENALATGHEALKMNDKRAAVYGVLCDANVELGNYEEAIEMADKMVASRPDLMSYARISYLREIHGDMDGAIQAMQMSANAGYPGLEQTAWAKYNLGQLYERTGNLQMAEITYKQALLERPEYAFATAGLGRIKDKSGNTKEAIVLLKEAAGALPEFSFQEELAHLYKKTGQEREAEKTMEELLEGFEADQEAGHIVDLELAKVYLELNNDPDKAMAYAMKEYKRRPNNIDVCKVMASIFYAKKDFGRANTMLKKATRTQKQDASLLCLNGLVNYKLGHRASGEHLLQQAFSLDPFQTDRIGAEGRSIISKRLSSL
ncbi:tetratricopeptide repeat protein [Pontibacter sp. MBLB2868]|uniref:tetratricopeptide repeat protein n=1 Tax=Pontibacter sp. MBLB2868 TaxID=3451555 RepID=UPI003F755905